MTMHSPATVPIFVAVSSSIYWFLLSHRGELSFLHFCICWRDSAVLSGYLFRQWPACVRVPNWQNVLGVSAVVSRVWNSVHFRV